MIVFGRASDQCERWLEKLEPIYEFSNSLIHIFPYPFIYFLLKQPAQTSKRLAWESRALIFNIWAATFPDYTTPVSPRFSPPVPTPEKRAITAVDGYAYHAKKFQVDFDPYASTLTSFFLFKSWFSPYQLHMSSNSLIFIYLLALLNRITIINEEVNNLFFAFIIV